LAAGAQPLPVIGVLYGVSAAEWTQPMTGFRRGLGEAGFVEGRNVSIEYRWADNHPERMPALIADLISRKVRVILTGGGAGGAAVIAASRNIPAHGFTTFFHSPQATDEFFHFPATSKRSVVPNCSSIIPVGINRR
jgi:basic membrane lipoprotein Med (substrate-binding protein (PBP1-ABC) superfamily)